jgi:hypothetical protein
MGLFFDMILERAEGFGSAAQRPTAGNENSIGGMIVIFVIIVVLVASIRIILVVVIISGIIIIVFALEFSRSAGSLVLLEQRTELAKNSNKERIRHNEMQDKDEQHKKH